MNKRTFYKERKINKRRIHFLSKQNIKTPLILDMYDLKYILSMFLEIARVKCIILQTYNTVDVKFLIQWNLILWASISCISRNSVQISRILPCSMFHLQTLWHVMEHLKRKKRDKRTVNKIPDCSSAGVCDDEGAWSLLNENVLKRTTGELLMKKKVESYNNQLKWK